MSGFPTMNTAEKAEAILLVLLGRMNWGGEVHLKLCDDNEGGKAFSTITPGTKGKDGSFDVSVPLFDGDVAMTFDRMIDALHAEVATVYDRPIRAG